MKGKMKKHLAAVLAFVLVLGTLTSGNFAMTVNAQTGDGATIALTQADVDRLNGSASVQHTTVHDPSVIKSNDGNYYIFGSHMAVSKTADLQNWTFVTGEDVNSPLFGDLSGGDASYNEAFLSGGDAEMGGYNVAEWISDHTVQGNMWAPDVIYNPTMNKYCMYLSLNGAKWNSAVILLTADSIEGPYVYQGPVVFSGFSTTDSTKNFKNTDLEKVIGEQAELPAKYQKIADDTWGEYWPHAIDPAVFYDAEGKLWMTYGSWSGGIYMLELDETTGLRDYNVTYASDFDSKGKSVTTDEYFGTKIAGGYYVSGEGPYIEKIGNYYYLFMSYGFYSPEGGYVMRVFRSENPDGPYVDGSGNSAIFDKYLHNYNGVNNMGMKLMGNYKWDTMAKAEVAQGHNSAFVDSDGKAYVVYHTKFNDGTAGHEVRVHQLFVNEEGWLVAAPYEYSGETISSTGYAQDDVTGSYELIIHGYKIDYANLAYNEAETINLNADGTVSGAYTGTWSATANSPYVTITLGEETYKGVFTQQIVDGSNITVMCFTATSASGVSIWGSGQPTDDVAVAQTAADASILIPEKTLTDLNLPTEGLSGASISWTSSNTAVLANDGTVTNPDADTAVTLTKRISKGDYYFEQVYTVTVMSEVDTTQSFVAGSYFTDDARDLSQHIDSSLSVKNPFYKGTTQGLDLSGGVTIEFDMVKTGDLHMLGTIFSFMGEKGNNGRLYFTPGSYLGYNALGGYFDANIVDYGLVTDYMGDAAHVAISITGDGFTVTVNDEVAYTQDILSTAGGGTLTDYSKVLTWLSETADTLYFGYGSWWNAATFDEAYVNLSNVVCSVNPSTEVVFDEVTYTKDEVVLATNGDITYEENPFFGKNIDNVTLKYTINMTEGTPMLGWDGIFSFFESASGGRVSVQTAPYICYNGGGQWMDINQPGAGGDNMAPAMEPGTEHDVVISITADAITMSVDGTNINLAYNQGGGVTYSDIISYITQCDKLTWGVGIAETAFWNTEQCTLTNVEFTSKGTEADEKPVNTNPEIIADEVVLSAYNSITIMDNPFRNAEFDELYVSYTINFAEETAMNGWDGIFSFYNTTTTGRVSFQTAPYICYNDWLGNWNDINQPGTDGASIHKYGFVPGVDYDVDMIITNDNLRMFLNGVEISYTENGSGATYASLLDCVASCNQFSFGVGEAQTAFWNTEICTLKDVEITTHAPAVEAITKDSFVLDDTADIERVENPFYGKQVEELYVEYTINFAEASAKNGWDGIFSFYNSASTGRISFQTAPYICYNDWAGKWMDINGPALGGQNVAAESNRGEDITFALHVTKDKVTMTANGEEIPFAENGSGATYTDLLEFISDCDQLTYGVGQAATSSWWTELCTVSDLNIAPVSIDAVADGNGTVTGATHSDRATLTATAAEGNQFDGWYVGDMLIGTEATLEVAACESITVTAKFSEVVKEPEEPVAPSAPAAPVIPAINWETVQVEVKAEVTSPQEENVNVEFTASGTIAVPAQVVASIAGQNVTAMFHNGTGVAMSISGQNVTGAVTGTVDVTVENDTNHIPAAVVETKTAGVLGSEQISVKNAGAFGVAVNMHVNVGKEFTGEFANLYKYNAVTGALEFVGYFNVNGDGQAMFALKEGGEYLLVVTDEKPVETIARAVQYIVKSGDSLYAIARMYELTLSDLKLKNPQITDENRIYVGDEIKVR